MEIVFDLEGEALWEVFMTFWPYWNSTGKNKSAVTDWSQMNFRKIKSGYWKKWQSICMSFCINLAVIPADSFEPQFWQWITEF